MEDQKKKSYPNKIWLFLAGANNDFTIQQQGLNVTLSLYSIVLIMAFIFNFICGYSIKLNLGVFIIIFVSIIFYFFSRRKSIHKIIISLYFVVMISFFPFLWFYNGGLFGSTIFYLLPLISYVIIICDGIMQIVLFSLLSITIFTIILVEYYHPELVIPLSNRLNLFIDITSSICINVFLSVLVVNVYKKLYQQEKKNTRDIIEQYRKNSDTLKKELNDKINLLSVRERGIFKLIIEGKTNKEIAQILNVSTGTIKNHITSIYKKFEVHKRIDILKEV